MTTDGLRLDPNAAARIVNGCFTLSNTIVDLKQFASSITSVSASGTYRSGSGVDKKLSDLGHVAVRALTMLQDEIDKAGAAARAGGQALINQDDENQRWIKRALDSPDGIDPAEKALPGGPIGYPGTRSSDPLAGAAAMVAPFGKPEAGPFPMNLIPEALPNFSIDPALAALGPAQPAALTTLSTVQKEVVERAVVSRVYARSVTFFCTVGGCGCGVASSEWNSSLTNNYVRSNAGWD